MRRRPTQTATSLADIADLSPPALRYQILALNTALYSPQVDAWEPKALLAAFHAFLSNNLEAIAHHLQPYQDDIRGVVVESTYNWYWLVDGLIEQG